MKHRKIKNQTFPLSMKPRENNKMADFNITVDTTPMARSVDTARDHIIGVNASVVAMNAAVIAAERASSKTICENVDRGFFTLVKSQISQKAVAAYTEMASKQVTLLQLAKSLDRVKRQMEDDYHSIAKRYAEHFNSLNKALETRVRELDRSAMRLAEIRKNMVFDRLKDDGSMLFSASSEAIPLAQTALSGKLKQKTRDTMLTLSDSINEDCSYNEKVDSIFVKNEDYSDCSELKYLPAIFFATDSLLNPEDSIESVYTADVMENTTPLVSEINRVQNALFWTALDKDEKDAIRREFLALCEKEVNEEHLAKEMLRLFDASSWEVLKQ
jgi:hypothetical protein